MRKRIALLVVLGLLLAMVASSVSAQGVDPGTGKTNIFMQNLGTGNAQVTVRFNREDTGTQDWETTLDPIPPKGSKYLLYTQFGVGDNWAGAAELASTEPLAAIVNMFWDGNSSAATYEGIDAPATEAYLPNLIKIANRQTRVTVQNTESTAASVSLKFYNRNGTLVGTKNDTIPAKAEKTYNLDNVTECDFSATSGVGSAYITSNTKIATMASIHYPDASAAYSGVSSGNTVVWVPGVFRKQPGGTWTFYSAIVVQNLGTTAANITVDLIGLPGKASTSFTDTIQPKASYGINTRSVGTMDPTKWNTVMTTIGTDWQGTLKITCTNGQPLAGVGFYFAPSINTDNVAYNAIRASDATNNALSMPAVYRKVTGTGQQFSTTMVQNLDNTAGTINVKFFGTDGLPKGNAAGYNVNLPANGLVRLNLKAGLELPAQALTDLGDNFSGAMYITSTGGNNIIGINIIIFESLRRASGYGGFPLH